MKKCLERIALWDTRASLALQTRRRRGVNTVLSALSWSGAGGAWTLLAVLLVATLRRGVELIPQQQRFLEAMLAALAVLLSTSVLKRLVLRRRPSFAGHGIRAAIWAPGDHYSFPSTHAGTAFALATALITAGHPLAFPVALWAVAVTFSRVWLGVHYVSDVAVGAALGVVFGLLPWARMLSS